MKGDEKELGSSTRQKCSICKADEIVSLITLLYFDAYAFGKIQKEWK